MANELNTAAAAAPLQTGNTRLVSLFRVTGMTCGNCARHVTQAIQSVPGVAGAVVELEAGQATVRWAAGAKLDVDAVVSAVEAQGFGAKPVALDAGAQAHDGGRMSGWRTNLMVGIPVTATLMIGEWVFGLGAVRWFQWVAFALASVVQVIAGGRFYRGAWGQLKAGSSNMDTLVALGSTTAFAYSVCVLFGSPGGHVYFMEAAAIITLISLGHWLEARVSLKASATLRQLLTLAPVRARRRSADGSETEVPVAVLQAGDVVAVRPGDRIPTDGVVIEGESAVDESMLTGESAPVDKGIGSVVYAGTVNVSGRLAFRVTATGEETALANIIAAVQRAQNSRANIQRLGDRVSSVFVPLVIVIAVLAALGWGLAPESAQQVHGLVGRFLWPAHLPGTPVATAFLVAASVLIIACPCAMGLATPAAIMAGSNAAARRGILIRDGVALEKAGKVTAVVFDKTGTLTVGKPSLVKVWEPDSAHAPAGLASRLAASLARHSSHPISQALATPDAAAVTLENWEEVRGAGVQASLRESGGMIIVRLGSLRWLAESGVDTRPGEAFIQEWSAEGATLIGLAANRELRGLFAVKDALKPAAAKVIEQLQRQGLKTFLVTGDNALTAAGIARQAAIPPTNVFAEVRPERKADFVRDLQQRGERVAFVGDGINDAPALEQADLGIAVARASDIAREAADIILLKSEIEAVPESLGLARATLRTIKQNLFWAFFYNAAGVPLAALGFLSPILCAAAMGLSDLIVIGNALRLRSWKMG
jgi:Cu+-exporting ATPase